jgi:hypothetical protein
MIRFLYPDCLGGLEVNSKEEGLEFCSFPSKWIPEDLPIMETPSYRGWI